MKELIIVQTFDKDGFLTGYEVNGELVRCKDCKHWNTAVESDKAENGLCYGFKFSLFVTPKDGFCFKGEKRK